MRVKVAELLKDALYATGQLFVRHVVRLAQSRINDVRSRNR
jgi:hypothetical protein